jgi:hypothetical protein
MRRVVELLVSRDIAIQPLVDDGGDALAGDW